jgi:hypothetical protein
MKLLGGKAKRLRQVRALALRQKQAARYLTILGDSADLNTPLGKSYKLAKKECDILTLKLGL